MSVLLTGAVLLLAIVAYRVGYARGWRRGVGDGRLMGYTFYEEHYVAELREIAERNPFPSEVSDAKQ